MSDYIEQGILGASEKARLSGEDFNEDDPVNILFINFAALVDFIQRVLEDGTSSITYRTTLDRGHVSMTVSDKYKSSDGKLCRECSVDHPDYISGSDDPKMRTSFSGIYCKEENKWQRISD